MGRALGHDTENLRIAGVVEEDGTGCGHPWPACHVLDDIDSGLGIAGDVHGEGVAPVGIGILVVLIPTQASGHGQGLAQSHALVARLGQLWNVACDRILQAADEAVMDGGAQQGGVD